MSTDSISDFIHEVFLLNVYSKLNQSPNANPNVNYDILHDVMQCAKNKHMPYKTFKLKKIQTQEICLDYVRSAQIHLIQK